MPVSLQRWRDARTGDHTGLTLIDATVVDPVAGESTPDAYVDIQAGRIAEVGPMSTRPRGRGSEISVEGRFVMPGLIDAHVHLVYSGYAVFRSIGDITTDAAAVNAAANARTVLRAGYTTVRDVGTIGNVAVALRDAIARGQLAGPRIVASGRIISSSRGPQYEAEDGPGFSVRADGPEQVAAVVRAQIDQGVDNVKLMASGVEANEFVGSATTTYSLEELRAGVEAAHAAGKTVAVHAQSYEAATYALRAGADTVEHGTRLNEEAVGLLSRRQTVLVPTLSTLYSVKELGEELNLIPKQRQEMAENEPIWLASLAAARQAGALIAAGGDVGNRYPHGGNARELLHLASSGMSAMDSLRAATTVAARALRLDSEVGSLEVGKVADLVILGGDPLIDLSVLLDPQNILLVLQSGIPVSGALHD